MVRTYRVIIAIHMYYYCMCVSFKQNQVYVVSPTLPDYTRPVNS